MTFVISPCRFLLALPPPLVDEIDDLRLVGIKVICVEYRVKGSPRDRSAVLRDLNHFRALPSTLPVEDGLRAGLWYSAPPGLQVGDSHRRRNPEVSIV